jgi:hypothetical protein
MKPFDVASTLTAVAAMSGSPLRRLASVLMAVVRLSRDVSSACLLRSQTATSPAAQREGASART